MAAVNYMDYELVFDQPDMALLDKQLQTLLTSSSCLIERTSPKGKKTVDIRPSLVKLWRDGNKVCYAVRLDKGAVPKPWEVGAVLLPDTPCSSFRTGMYIMAGDKLIEP